MYKITFISLNLLNYSTNIYLKNLLIMFVSKKVAETLQLTTDILREINLWGLHYVSC